MAVLYLWTLTHAARMQESRVQAEFDDVLREALFLRRDLEAEMESCRTKQVPTWTYYIIAMMRPALLPAHGS